MKNELGKNSKLFQKIWNNYNKRIYYFISQVVNRRDLYFDDLFQEIMIKISENIDNYKKGYSLDVWIYMLVRNHCIDYLRKKEIKTNDLEKHVIASADYDPEKMAVTKEVYEKINSVLEKFNPPDRQITYFYYFENMKYRDISKILGINVNTIKTKMVKIKRILKDALRDFL